MLNQKTKTIPVQDRIAQSTEKKVDSLDEDMYFLKIMGCHLSFIDWGKRRKRNSEPDPKIDKNRLVHRIIDHLLFHPKYKTNDSADLFFLGDEVAPKEWESHTVYKFESDEEAIRVFTNDLYLEEIQESIINSIRNLTERKDFVVRRRNSPFFAKPEVAYHYNELKFK